MTDLRTAAQQALEALEYINQHGFVLADYEGPMAQAITALKAALAQPDRTGSAHCERACEAEAFKIEIRRLKALLAQQAEPVAWPAGKAELHISLLNIGKHMAKERSREIGDAWNQLADLLHLLSKARNTPPAALAQEKRDFVTDGWVALAGAAERIAKDGGSGSELCAAIDRLSAAIMDSDALAQQAEPVCSNTYGCQCPKHYSSAQQAEPVAWIDDSGHPKHRLYRQSATEKRLYGPLRPLYTAPPAAQRKPLTVEEIWSLYYDQGHPEGERSDRVDFVRAIERAHGITQPCPRCSSPLYAGLQCSACGRVRAGGSDE